jgi:hypothetical protein
LHTTNHRYCVYSSQASRHGRLQRFSGRHLSLSQFEIGSHHDAVFALRFSSQKPFRVVCSQLCLSHNSIAWLMDDSRIILGLGKSILQQRQAEDIYPPEDCMHASKQASMRCLTLVPRSPRASKRGGQVAEDAPSVRFLTTAYIHTPPRPIRCLARRVRRPDDKPSTRPPRDGIYMYLLPGSSQQH